MSDDPESLRDQVNELEREVAIGGGACGYYACGAGAVGEHVISASRQDPAAVKFFSQWFPWAF